MPTSSARRRTEVTFADQTWALKNLSAYEWILTLRTDPKDLSHVFPGLVRDRDLDRLLDVAKSMDIDEFQRRCTNVARVAITRTCGWSWWRCLNLVDKACDNWTIVNGMMLLEGCDAQGMDLSSWLSAAYVVQIRNMKQEDMQKFEFEINRMPVGVAVSTSTTAAKKALMDFAAD